MHKKIIIIILIRRREKLWIGIVFNEKISFVIKTQMNE
jgi:hypothetical protein